ncbi:MAG TPA: hypothetical protein VIV11_13080 [Kofleriaceae bacterium]
MRQQQLTLALLALCAAGAVARAQAPGYERFEISDLTLTLRDDTFSTLATDPDDSRIVYVGTHQGRVYRTSDGGRVWTESTVIAEQNPLWATPGSTIFFGAIRSSEGRPSDIDLIGSRSSPIDFAHLPGQLSRFAAPTTTFSPLARESAISASVGSASLGVGLSERSPRLSLLTAARGRPVPTLSRVRFLVDRTLRGSVIFNITVDPNDRRLLFAATSNGLYKSYDGGESWTRSFAGMTSAERTAFRIAIRRGDPALAILGTASGAYVSTDKGDNWSKIATAGGMISDVAFDPNEPRNIYLATNGGVLRSTDGGQTFATIYYSTFPAEADVRRIVLDPFDAETAYVGTMRGVFVTRKLSTARIDDWAPLAGVQSILAASRLAACSRHRGHLYALTTVELPAINYGADAPESAIIESWDGGKTWRQLFTGMSDGKAETFALDAADPDQLWIGWTTALHRLDRTAERDVATTTIAHDDRPSISELVLATLRHHGVELDVYADKTKRSFARSLVPRLFAVSGAIRQWSAGGILDDAQFASGRYLQIADARGWEVMAWASWDLPEGIYSASSVPMIRERVPHMNDEVRHRLMETVRRNYGELARLQSIVASTQLDIKTRVTYRLRIEQLEALIDLTSGGYLGRWYKRHRRQPR